MSLAHLMQRTLTFTPRRWTGRAALAWRWAPLLAWMLVIFVLSHQPKENIPDAGSWDLLVKKSAHFAGYALLWLLCRRAGYRPWAALAVSVAFALGDELHQVTIPGRTGRPLDIFIDTAGALSALLVATRRRQRT